MAAICEVKVSQQLWHNGRATLKGHKEGHKRSQMMVWTHSFW